LETGQFEPVGATRTRTVSVRVLSATNADLPRKRPPGVSANDLLFRLNTVEIHVPPLRERREDIPLLAAHFLRRHAARYRKHLASFDAEAMRSLLDHSWPGNVRELDHAIERAALMGEGERSGPRARSGG
jgi:DNA-binding NtrC family response regulator